MKKLTFALTMLASILLASPGLAQYEPGARLITVERGQIAVNHNTKAGLIAAARVLNLKVADVVRIDDLGAALNKRNGLSTLLNQGYIAHDYNTGGFFLAIDFVKKAAGEGFWKKLDRAAQPLDGNGWRIRRTAFAGVDGVMFYPPPSVGVLFYTVDGLVGAAEAAVIEPNPPATK